MSNASQRIASRMMSTVRSGNSSCTKWPARSNEMVRAVGSRAAMRAVSAGDTQPSLAPTINVTGCVIAGTISSSALRSQCANIDMSAAAWRSDCANMRYLAACAASMVDPVDRMSDANTWSFWANRAVSAPTTPTFVSTRIAGDSSDSSGCGGASAALRPTSVVRDHVRANQSASAPPAEWPTIAVGVSCIDRSSTVSDAAIPRSESCATVAHSVKPWPGKSGATTVQCAASRGAISRQVWVAAPDPCSNSTTGPVPSRWTCQRRPSASINWLALAFGQSSRTASHVGAVLMQDNLSGTGRCRTCASSWSVAYTMRHVVAGSNAG